MDITQADDLKNNFDRKFRLKDEKQIDAMNEAGTWINKSRLEEKL